ncbi:MAG: cation:proton antiporter [Planctomycetota bacterium]
MELLVNPEFVLVHMAVILVLGIGAQWVAWRTRIPGILLLLLAGFLAGPVAQQLATHGWLPGGMFLDPDTLFGRKLIGPMVSLAVGVILYEGGLTLQLREIREVGPVIRNLVSIGAVVTWLLAAAAARWILGMTGGLALLLGAILVVTGPTVIGPLLRQVRPQGPVGSALKWEGIVIDPIGATLAVLVFEVVRGSNTPWGTVFGFAETAVYGGGLGLLGAGILIFALKRHLIPDMLENAFSLALVFAIFAGANVLHHEAGLLATTVMGIVLANQKSVTVHHIIHFKENLRVLLLAVLFVVLSARVDLDVLLQALNWRVAGFVAALILVVRPATVAVSTAGPSLEPQGEDLPLLDGPRGIGRRRVRSSLRLVEADIPEAASSAR